MKQNQSRTDKGCWLASDTFYLDCFKRVHSFIDRCHAEAKRDGDGSGDLMTYGSMEKMQTGYKLPL